MMHFTLGNFIRDITTYKRHQPEPVKIYVNRTGGCLTVYFFIESIEDFPKNIYDFEKKLQEKYSDLEVNVKVIPYEEESVNNFAISRNLIPV